MRDICFVKSSYSTLSHIVVLSVDYVKFLFRVDYRLNNLLCFLCVPLSCLLCNQVPLVSLNCFIQGTGTSYLCCSSHLSLKMNDIVLFQFLVSQPVNSGLTFFFHIGYDRSYIEIVFCVNSTVKKNHLYAFCFCIL